MEKLYEPIFIMEGFSLEAVVTTTIEQLSEALEKTKNPKDKVLLSEEIRKMGELLLTLDALSKQKNTPKGVYVGKCPKCRYENRRQMTNWQLENGLPNFCSQCGARTTYQKHQFV